MSDKKNRNIFSKREIRMFVIALLPLFIISIAYYFHIRHEALHQVEKKAEITLQNTENSILARMGKIETTVNAMQPMVEFALEKPDAMYDVAKHIVEASSRIMGAGIAFKANYYPEKGYWFETYTGYQQGCDTMVTTQLGSPDHNYLEMEWFKKGLESTKGFWSNPYYDNAGGKTFMISYCAPVRDKTNEAVGVICADITLDTLASIVRSIKLYPHSFCTLIADDGTLLVAPPDTPKKRKCHVYAENIDGKNMTLVITIPDADMYRRLRLSTLFFALMALTGILSVFCITYRSLLNQRQLNEAKIKEQHIEDELNIARKIQQSLLPSASASNIAKNFEVKGLQIPAKYVGGDLYDYYVRDNKLFFCIGDISGKGVPAALLMAISHSLFRTISAHNDQPEQIMEALNTAISDNNPDIMFLTMFLGILDLSTGMVSYCNAGHNPPIIVKNGHAEYLATEPSLLMGVDIDAKYVSYTLTLDPGDTLFLYTDGLTEAENEQKELFGEGRTLNAIAEFHAMTAEEQVQHIQQRVQLFVNQAEQSDDLTLLAIRHAANYSSSLSLTNDINELTKLEPFLNNFLESNRLDMSLFQKIDLALEEALTNIIMYAYPEDEQGEIHLNAEVQKDRIHFEISDKGIPFDPLQHQEDKLDVPLEERKIGGLGIHLIKEIMDTIEYENKEGRNVLRLEMAKG